MTIAELLTMEAGTKGINVVGKISGVWPAKKNAYGVTQFFLLSDGKDIIGVQARDVTLTDGDKGKGVSIIGGKWISYQSNKGETKFILEVPKSKTSELRIGGMLDTTPTKKPETNLDKVKEEILQEYKDSLVKATEILSDEVLSQMVTVCKEKG